jgi:hypothetical protein
MTSAPGDDVRALPHLVSLGAVGAAIAAVFFGIAFLWLAPQQPAEPPADLDSPTEALEFQEVPSPANNDKALGRSTESPAGNVTANPLPSALPLTVATTTGAPSNPAAPALVSTSMEAMLIPPAKITHAKRVRVSLFYRQATARDRAALWRPDASAGPLPGGGFYGPPNINVGYINPR